MAAQTFYARDIVIERTTAPKPKPAKETLGFGQQFSDHMLVVEWDSEHGWGKPVIKPFGPLPMHPASHALNYGASCFEGMKAYKCTKDGSVRLFRPTENAARFLRSCLRLALPAFEPSEFLGCIEALLRVDSDWVPEGRGYSVYVRPNAMTTNEYMALSRPTKAMINIILAPSAPYFAGGHLTPAALFVDEEYVRAWPGGAGSCKLGSNYAPTILPQIRAMHEHGCAQVLYSLPAASGDLDDAIVGEAGAMNMFFILSRPDGTRQAVTPPLTDGTILPGVTRKSVIDILREFGDGVTVEERNIQVRELQAASDAGTLAEAFGCGTAVAIMPISEMRRKDGRAIKCGTTGADEGSLTFRVFQRLTDIQYGEVEGHPWSHKV